MKNSQLLNSKDKQTTPSLSTFQKKMKTEFKISPLSPLPPLSPHSPPLSPKSYLLVYRDYQDFLRLLFSLPITTGNIVNLFVGGVNNGDNNGDNNYFLDTKIVNKFLFDFRGMNNGLLSRENTHSTHSTLFLPCFLDDIHPWYFSLADDEIDNSVLTHHILVQLASDNKYFGVFVSLMNKNIITSLPMSFYTKATKEAILYLVQHHNIFQRSDTHSLIEHLTCQSLLSGNLNLYCCLRFLSFISDETKSLQNHLFISDLFLALDILLTPDSSDSFDHSTPSTPTTPSKHKFSFITDNKKTGEKKLWTLIFCLLKSKRLNNLKQLIPLITDSHLSQLVKLLTTNETENNLDTHTTLISSYVALSAVCSYDVCLLLKELIKDKFTQLFELFIPISSTNKSYSLWHKDIISINYEETTHRVLNYEMNPSEKTLLTLTPLPNLDKVLVKEFQNHFVTIYETLVYFDQLCTYFSIPISKGNKTFNFYNKSGQLLLVSKYFPQSLQHLTPSLLESIKTLIIKTCHKNAPIILNRTIVWENNKSYSISFSPIVQDFIDTTNSPSYKDILSLFLKCKQLETTTQLPFVYDHTKPLTIFIDSQRVLHLLFSTTNANGCDLCDFTLESLALLQPLQPPQTQRRRHLPICKNYNNINDQIKLQANEIYVTKTLYTLITDEDHTAYQRGILKVFNKKYSFSRITDEGYYLYKFL